MEKKKWILWGAVGLACLLIAVILAYYLDYLPILEPVNLKMQAYELSEDGKVLDSFPLEIKGTLLDYRRRSNQLDGVFQTPDSFRYKLIEYTNQPYPQSSDIYEKLGAFVSVTYAWSKDTNEPAFLDFALDTEKGYLILLSHPSAEDNDMEWICVVAAVDPKVTPQEILSHFEWFLQ